MNKFEETKIVNVGDSKITIIEGTDNTSLMIIIIASSTVVLLLLGLLARFFWNKMREQKARAEQIKATQKNLNRGKIQVLPKRGDFNSKSSKVDVGQTQQIDDNSPQDPINSQDLSGEIYEEQYDPNQEFRIFGIGDKTKGGVQSLQEKMNMADDVSGDSSSEEEEEEQDKNASENLQVPNPQSQNDMSMMSSSQLFENQALMNTTSPLGSISNPSETKNNLLPEDNEIIDEEEEEEEE